MEIGESLNSDREFRRIEGDPTVVSADEAGVLHLSTGLILAVETLESM